MTNLCRAGAQRGMTLIELMVAITVGLGITLAITSMLIVGENHKRTTTSTNDAEQTGAYVFHALDRAIRGAGSGFASSAYVNDRGILGCRLNVSTILPRASTLPLPAPFASVTSSSDLRVAPVLIGKGQSQAGSDVLIVMNGSGSSGGVPRQLAGAGSTTTLVLANSVGLMANDLVLLSQSGKTSSSQPDCLLEQISSISGTTLNLGGTYYTAGSTSTTTVDSLASSTGDTYATPLGNANANNLQLTLYGVGDNRILYSYDLLQGTGTDSAQAMADGVVQLRALYGVDTNGIGMQDSWADPGTAPYDITSVMKTPSTMQKILSVRVALVLRNNYYDRNNGNAVSPQTLTLFQGLTNATGTSLQQSVTLSDDDRHYRYRVFEFTVPVRNMLILAGGP